MNATKSRNRKKWPPETLYEGRELSMAQAIYDGNIKEVERLIKVEKFNPNALSLKGEFTYLCYAVIMEDIEVMQKLLELGADPNQVSPDKQHFSTPLEQAAGRHNVPMVKLLLRYKANPNTLLGPLPIHEALIGDGGKETIELLLANGADINYREYLSGDMPLPQALLIEKLDYVNYFLDKGADPAKINFTGISFAYAVQDELLLGRLNKDGIRQMTILKERLEKEYHIQFPVKLEARKGLKERIKQYEALPMALKELPGMDVDKRGNERAKERLEKGVNALGKPLD